MTFYSQGNVEMSNSDSESETADLANETGSNWFYSLMEDMAEEVTNNYRYSKKLFLQCVDCPLNF